MATQKQKRKRRFFSNARLITIETISLVGLIQVWFEEWLLNREEIPGWLKILILMGIMIGILGFLLVYIEQVTKKSLSRAHHVAKSIPFPITMLMAHLAVFALLFYLYGETYGILWLP